DHLGDPGRAAPRGALPGRRRPGGPHRPRGQGLLMQAPIAEQRALLQLQAHDSAIDRLEHRRGSLPEDARLAELADGRAAGDQLSGERQGSLATVQRDQSRLEDEIDMVTTKAGNEEERAVSGKVTSPKELTAIQEEVASLKRR